MTQHIALYGKGGVGKSTVTANISAALAEAGYSVIQVGCDPKADSCRLLNSGLPIPTVFDLVRDNREITREAVTSKGYKDISCIELGDPFPYDGCVSAEINRAFDLLGHSGLFTQGTADYVLYDIPGETVCSGLYAPLRHMEERRVFVVTSSDYMSLYAANTIFRMLERHVDINGPVHAGGLIPNGIANSFEESFVSDFAFTTRTQVVNSIPRSLVVKQAELYGKTVIEAAPLSNQSFFYRRLAKQIVSDSLKQSSAPLPMQPAELRKWARIWADRINAMENGLVSDGAAI